MARPIRNVLTKITELFFQNVSPPWVFRVQQWFMTQINRTEREQNTKLSFLKILEFALSITKKLYFDPCLGVSIKMYLLPGFKSHTFETQINVQLKSPCKTPSWVLSKFLTRFSVNRVLNFQKSRNFNFFHTKYFWTHQKVLS